MMGRRVLALLATVALGAACAAIPLETFQSVGGGIRAAVDAPALGAIQPRSELKVGRRVELQPRGSWSAPLLAILCPPRAAEAALVARLLEAGSISLVSEQPVAGGRTTRGPPRLSAS
jgi:hypothetical protein